MSDLTIDHIINEVSIAKNIFYHLSNADLRGCSLVNKIWYLAVRESRKRRKLKITVELLDKLNSKDKSLENYIRKKYKLAPEVDIYGWSRGTHIQNDVYDKIFNPEFRAKTLILRGRGCWNSCHCPAKGSLCGEQIDTIDEGRFTNLESIHVGTTFCISACALLDLVSRSPKLKILKFYGLITMDDHNELFSRLRFHCNLERLYWPWPSKRHVPTLTTLVKRNENLNTLFSNSETTMDLLAADALPKLRYLSLALNENWKCKPGNIKKANRYLQRIQYLSLAKNIEALEVRTFEIDEMSECSETGTKVERIFESYKLSFWDQVSKLPNLKFLAIYGAWEFEEVCREMAKHALQIEFLKINLMPTSVVSALDALEDCPVLSMVDGVKNLKKLSKLKSLHYICYERLGSIDPPTVAALKEIKDLIWAFDVKVGFTEEIEDLLNHIMRRGNQLGKTYKYYIHILSKLESNYVSLLSEQNLKYPLGANLKDKVASIAEYESNQRYRKAGYEKFYIWGLKLINNHRDRATYDNLASNWKIYDDQFYVDLTII